MTHVLLFLLACASDPGAGKPAAKVEPPPAPTPAAPVATPPPAPAAPVGKTSPIDVARSSIKAVGAKISATHDITFGEYSGALMVDGENLTGVSFTVQMASLKVEPEKLAGHLKTADFFDIEKFPTASFTATAVKAGSETAGATHTVTGDMTIHGQTKSVSFPATVTMSPTEVSAKAEFSINRQDFGVVYPGKPDDLIKDNVLLSIAMVAAR